MTDKNSNIKDAAEIVKAIVESVPVYTDSLQPAAKQIGKSLELVTKAINIALFPLKGMVWGYEKIEQLFIKNVAAKLSDVSQEDIITPSPQIAVPTIEALRYTGDNENLRELFANLLAAAMNKATQQITHPSYVDIIKNISSDEALLIKLFRLSNTCALIKINATSEIHSDQKHVDSFTLLHQDAPIQNINSLPVYINNLCRLGILEIPFGRTLTDKIEYDRLKKSDEFLLLETYFKDLGYDKIEVQEAVLRTTAYGANFIKAVT